ncbi:hypothetical protein QQ008_01170 [Fulvivirgaceae bacterium BMA10]|uniref:Uncharacterized protein n=1 Tax=Splendidivirga corallicola TaxID=3051826 RepID=A0ABT8KGU5_9BACT|nr:hypothetical protein [Fulvivirgaceae bacterium BMA10]
MKTKFNIPLLLCLFMACTQNNVGTSQTPDNYKSIAKSKLGDDAKFNLSPEESYVLCLKETKGSVNQPQNHIKFFVYDLNSKLVVYENAIDNATVKWHSDDQLEIYRIPGIMKEGTSADDYTKIYDVKTGKSVAKSQLK